MADQEVVKKAAKKTAVKKAAAPKKAAAAKNAAPKPATVATKAAAVAGAAIDPGLRATMIAEAAYYRAEQRGFGTGGDIADWLAAEQEIDARLSRR